MGKVRVLVQMRVLVQVGVRVMVDGTGEGEGVRVDAGKHFVPPLVRSSGFALGSGSRSGSGLELGPELRVAGGAWSGSAVALKARAGLGRG